MIKSYGMSMMYGTAHTSQSLPRMLTLWFDFGTFRQAFRGMKPVSESGTHKWVLVVQCSAWVVGWVLPRVFACVLVHCAAGDCTAPGAVLPAVMPALLPWHGSGRPSCCPAQRSSLHSFIIISSFKASPPSSPPSLPMAFFPRCRRPQEQTRRRR